MGAWLPTFMRDAQFGARTLLKSPGVTALAVVSLATGIMVATAIYSVRRVTPKVNTVFDA